MFYEEDIKKVIDNHTGLFFHEDLKLLKGQLNINHTFCDEHIIAAYDIEIHVPEDYFKKLPRIKNIDKKVPLSFGHIYQTGELCLATDADQLVFFAEGNDLNDWVNSYVIPYFFAVEYYKKYKIYPFGERKHGVEGILEYYFEAFNVNEDSQVVRMLDYIISNRYRGHAACPCGSGKKLRDCHKEIILNWKQGKYKNILLNDYHLMVSDTRRTYAGY